MEFTLRATVIQGIGDSEPSCNDDAFSDRMLPCINVLHRNKPMIITIALLNNRYIMYVLHTNQLYTGGKALISVLVLIFSAIPGGTNTSIT